MKSILKYLQFGAAALAVAVMLSGMLPISALAETTSPASTAVVLPEATIKALQEALTKQGIVVKADGVLTDETRAAIRKYQSVHHLPVTGEPDKATLDKLGVVTTQGAAGPPSQGQMPGGMMMSGPMMQGMMKGMMQTMQGMMGMMKGQMQPAPAQPAAQGSMMMNCPMMPGANQNQGAAPAMMQMMQMMQGMMQMMQMMQGQMQSGQMPPGSQ